MRRGFPSSSRFSRKGFTLTEILAATGIMMVIILLVLTLTTNILSSWTRSSGQLETNFEARVALDLLTSDLESMVVRNRKICWMQLEYQSISDDLNDGSSPILYFFAPTLERPRTKSNGDAILGDVCAISYRQAFRNPFIEEKTKGEDPSPVYGLYRSVVDAENTFNYALAIGNYDPSAGTDGYTLVDFWNNEAVDSDGVDITSQTYDENGELVPNADETFLTWIDSSSNFLSQNVAKFELLFWYIDSSGTPTAIPQGSTFIYAGSGLYVNGTLVSGARLAFVDVTLTILNSEGAGLLNQGTVTYDEAISDYGDVFTRRINLLSNPL